MHNQKISWYASINKYRELMIALMTFMDKHCNQITMFVGINKILGALGRFEFLSNITNSINIFHGGLWGISFNVI